MKKVILLAAMCLMALTTCTVFSCSDKDNESSGVGESSGAYVDLGLSSGTLWKTSNEENASDAEYAFFTYDEAVSQFGSRLPSKEQREELKAECQWAWTGSGYKVTGPNGNSITLPAAGWRNRSGSVNDVGSNGVYWSSTPKDSEDAWVLVFDSHGVYVDYGSRCCGHSVRLVQD